MEDKHWKNLGIKRWQNLDIKNWSNAVFVEILTQNRLYVQFPSGSKQDNKIKVLNNGSSIGLFDWSYLRKLEESNYKIVLLNTSSVFENKEQSNIVNSLQSFEIAILYIRDISNLIFCNQLLITGGD